MLVPWCCDTACEKLIKKQTKAEAMAEAMAAAEGDDTMLSSGAKSLCIPFDQTMAGQELPSACIRSECANVATSWCLFGRSY